MVQAVSGATFSFEDAEKERIKASSAVPSTITWNKRTFKAKPVPASTHEKRLPDTHTPNSMRPSSLTSIRGPERRERAPAPPLPAAPKSFMQRVEREYGQRISSVSEQAAYAHSLWHRHTNTEAEMQPYPSTSHQPSMRTAAQTHQAETTYASPLAGGMRTSANTRSAETYEDRGDRFSQQRIVDTGMYSASSKSAAPYPIHDAGPIRHVESAREHWKHKRSDFPGAYIDSNDATNSHFTNDVAIKTKDQQEHYYGNATSSRILEMNEAERSLADHLAEKSSIDTALAIGSEESLQRYRDRIAQEAAMQLQQEHEQKEAPKTNEVDDKKGTQSSSRFQPSDVEDDWSWMDRYRTSSGKSASVPEAYAQEASAFARALSEDHATREAQKDAAHDSNDDECNDGDAYVSDSEIDMHNVGKAQSRGTDSPHSAGARLMIGLDGDDDDSRSSASNELQMYDEPLVPEAGWRHTGCVHYMGEGAHGDGMPAPEVVESRRHVPRGFSFLQREEQKPMRIRDENTISDVLMQQQAETSELQPEFKAKKPPPAVRQRRFKAMMQKQQERRAERKAESISRLKEQVAPFSFYERDMQRQREREEERRRAKREHRKALKESARRARDPPRSSLEPKMEELRRQAERRRAQRRQAALERWKQAAPPERVRPDSASSQRSRDDSRATRGKQQSKAMLSFTPKPVPDFQELHAQSESELSARKATRPPTTPEPFRTASRPKQSGRSRNEHREEEEAAHARRRWPHRNHVDISQSQRTHKPVVGQRPLSAPLTKAQALRSQEVQKRFGPFDYEESKRQKEIEEQQRREHDRKQRERARAKSSAKMPSTQALSDESQQKHNIPGAPRQHVQSRHRQAEEQARAAVEEVMMKHDLFEYTDDL